MALLNFIILHLIRTKTDENELISTKLHVYVKNNQNFHQNNIS
jgi:hypothetical protein